MKKSDYIKLKVQKQEAEKAYETAKQSRPFSYLRIAGAMDVLNKTDQKIICEGCRELL